MFKLIHKCIISSNTALDIVSLACNDYTTFSDFFFSKFEQIASAKTLQIYYCHEFSNSGKTMSECGTAYSDYCLYSRNSKFSFLTLDHKTSLKCQFFEIFPLMYGLLGSDNIWPRYNYFKIWNLRVQKHLNIEKIIFKVVQIKFLLMHITNQKLFCEIFAKKFLGVQPDITHICEKLLCLAVLRAAAKSLSQHTAGHERTWKARALPGSRLQYACLKWVAGESQSHSSGVCGVYSCWHVPRMCV